jgi:hypothetical protein
VDDFSVHASLLANEADDRLGDLIQYAINGALGGNYVAIKGRLVANEQPVIPRGFERMDEIQSQWRLRVSAANVPSPTKNDRVQCDAILGAGETYRPVAADPIRDGRYWLVGLQRA